MSPIRIAGAAAIAVLLVLPATVGAASSFSPPVAISAPGSASDDTIPIGLDPRVESLPGSGAIVVWSRERGFKPTRIQGSFVDPSGHPGPLFNIAVGGVPPRSPWAARTWPPSHGRTARRFSPRR